MVSKIIHFITEVYDAVYPKVKNATIGALVFGLLGLCINFAWWRYAPYDVATVEQPIQVLNENNQVEAGGVLSLGIVVSKTGDYVADTILRNTICTDGSIYGAEPVSRVGENLPVGEFKPRIRDFVVSEQLPKGEFCYFQFDLFYQVNPVRTIKETWVSGLFEVV